MKVKKRFISLLWAAMLILSVNMTAVAAAPNFLVEENGDLIVYYGDYDDTSKNIGYYRMGYEGETVFNEKYNTTMLSLNNRKYKSIPYTNEKVLLGNYVHEFEVVVPEGEYMLLTEIAAKPDGTVQRHSDPNNMASETWRLSMKDGKMYILGNYIGKYREDERYRFRYEYDFYDRTIDAYFTGTVDLEDGTAQTYDNEKITTYTIPSNDLSIGLSEARFGPESEPGMGYFDNMKIYKPAVTVASMQVRDGIAMEGTDAFEINLSRFITNESIDKIKVRKNDSQLVKDEDYTITWKYAHARKEASGYPTITLTEPVAVGDQFEISFAECVDEMSLLFAEDQPILLGSDAVLEFECPDIAEENDARIHSINLDGVTVEEFAGQINGVVNGTPVSVLKEAAETAPGVTMKVYNESNAEVADNGYIYDGFKIISTAKDGITMSTYTVNAPTDVYTYNFNNANNANILSSQNRNYGRLMNLFSGAGAEYVEGNNPFNPTESWGYFQNAFLPAGSTEETASISGGTVSGKSDYSAKFSYNGLKTTNTVNMRLLKDFWYEDGNIYALNFQVKPAEQVKFSVEMSNKYYNWKQSDEPEEKKDFISAKNNFIIFNDNYDGSLMVNNKKYAQYEAENWFDVSVILDMSQKESDETYKRTAYFYINGTLVDTHDFSDASNTHSTFAAIFCVEAPVGTITADTYLDNISSYKLYTAEAPASKYNSYTLLSDIGEVSCTGVIKIPQGTTVRQLTASLSGLPENAECVVYNKEETVELSSRDEIDLTAENKLVIKCGENTRSYTLKANNPYTLTSGEGEKDVLSAGENTVTIAENITGVVVAVIKNDSKITDVYMVDTADMRTITIRKDSTSSSDILEIYNFEDLVSIKPLREKVKYYGKN